MIWSSVDWSFYFKVPRKSGVDEAFCKLANAADQADRTVAVSLCFVFPFLVHRHHDGFLPYLFLFSSCHLSGVEVSSLLRAKVDQHLIGVLLWVWVLFQLQCS